MTRTPESLARARFIAIASMRIVGALMILAGFALIRGGFEVAGQPTDRWVGVAIVLIGAFDFAVMPKILARRWRTPR
jgi:hypothetical protein